MVRRADGWFGGDVATAASGNLERTRGRVDDGVSTDNLATGLDLSTDTPRCNERARAKSRMQAPAQRSDGSSLADAAELVPP